MHVLQSSRNIHFYLSIYLIVPSQIKLSILNFCLTISSSYYLETSFHSQISALKGNLAQPQIYIMICIVGFSWLCKYDCIQYPIKPLSPLCRVKFYAFLTKQI